MAGGFRIIEGRSDPPQITPVIFPASGFGSPPRRRSTNDPRRCRVVQHACPERASRDDCSGRLSRLRRQPHRIIGTDPRSRRGPPGARRAATATRAPTRPRRWHRRAPPSRGTGRARPPASGHPSPGRSVVTVPGSSPSSLVQTSVRVASPRGTGRRTPRRALVPEHQAVPAPTRRPSRRTGARWDDFGAHQPRAGPADPHGPDARRVRRPDPGGWGRQAQARPRRAALPRGDLTETGTPPRGWCPSRRSLRPAGRARSQPRWSGSSGDRPGP